MLTRTQDSSLSRRAQPFYGAWLLDHLPFKQILKGSLSVELGDFQRRYIGPLPGPHADLVINNPLRFFWLLLSEGELGFARAYAQNDIQTACLHTLLSLGALNEPVLAGALKGQAWFYRRWLKRHRANHNSIENSRDNIAAHYDLGNNFYRLWLDDTMTYSSALFSHPQQSLADAQQAKYQRIVHELDAEPGEHILEIGCGWGGFMQHAAQQGLSVTGLTLSSEQQAFAQARLAGAELTQRTEVKLTDYRHQQGQFDHIVSIEMFEAVGLEYWDTYFGQLKSLLKAEGRALLQVITIDENYADAYQQGVDFIQSYIFPGGLLPSPTQLHRLAEKHGFRVRNQLRFGQDYALTLQRWRQRFDQHRDTLEMMGYDAHFQRIWHYYLDYCRVGFETERIDVLQLTLEHR